MVLQDCNLVEYNSNYLTNPPSYQNALWASQAYTSTSDLCHVVVSSANGGSLQVRSATCQAAASVEAARPGSGKACHAG